MLSWTEYVNSSLSVAVSAEQPTKRWESDNFGKHFSLNSNDLYQTLKGIHVQM